MDERKSASEFQEWDVLELLRSTREVRLGGQTVSAHQLPGYFAAAKHCAYREPGVLSAFEKLWGTDELIVSYDTINLTLPNASKMGGSKPWPHVDQAPERKGLSCVQGIINRASSI
jgi:hypothetical protein